VAEYCDEHDGLCVCLFVSVREHISGTTRAIFTNVCVRYLHVNGRGSVPRRRCDKLRISGFVNDVLIVHNWPGRRADTVAANDVRLSPLLRRISCVVSFMFMTHVTCRLTAKNRDQLRSPTLGSRVWATLTFLCRMSGHFDGQSDVGRQCRQVCPRLNGCHQRGTVNAPISSQRSRTRDAHLGCVLVREQYATSPGTQPGNH